MKNKWVLPNIAALLLVLVVNSMATALPLNGQSTADVSDSFPVLFKPAGYVFSIWGVIYLFLIAYVVYQSMPRQKSNPYLIAIGGLFTLSCLLNSAWIFAWHYNQIILSVVIMVLLLLTLISVYLRIASVYQPMRAQDRWLVKMPFSIYLSWICVATIANVSIALYSINWSGWGIADVTWTILMLCVGGLLAAYMILVRHDNAFGFVFVWAFAGVYVEQAGTAGVRQGAMIVTLALCAMLLYSHTTKRNIAEWEIYSL